MDSGLRRNDGWRNGIIPLKLSFLLAFFSCSLSSDSVFAEPIAITASPVTTFQNLSSTSEFGPFSWRGGLSLSSTERKFGGFSGLIIGNNCEDLLAVSDAGRWFKATLNYDGAMLAGIATAELAPMLDSKAKPQRSKVWGDAEAVAEVAPGRVAVAYESRVRFGVYDLGRDGFKAPFKPFRHPRDIDGGADNGEVEALAVLPAGSFIAVSEKNRDADGNARAWMWSGKTSLQFTIAGYLDYAITDIVVLADGNVLTLERSFSHTSLPGMAIRRFAASRIGKDANVKPELLFEGRVPFFAIDNMEGIAACTRDGETRLTIISDNNFNTRLQQTLLLQFAYKP